MNLNNYNRAGSKYLSYQTEPSKTYFILRGWTLTNEELAQQNVPDSAFSQKNGFIYDPDKKEWIYEFPDEFTAPSDHDKYVIFQYCRCCIDDHYPADVEVHSSFIPRDQYCDSLVYYANVQVPDDNRKYKVNCNTKTEFRVWFTNGKGDPYKNQPVPTPPDSNGDGDPQFNFVVFLKLIY